MRTHFILCSIIFVLVMLHAHPAHTDGTDSGQGFRIVQGEVLTIEGDTYLVRDENGKEIRMTVSEDLKINQTFAVGDRIVAQVSDQGVVALINRSGAPPGVPLEPRSHQKDQ